MPTDEKVTGVVGAGVMGVGVAHALARVGFSVIVVDCDPTALERAKGEIERAERLTALLRKTGADPAGIVQRIRFASDVGALHETTYLVENVTENWEIKRSLYGALDKVCPPSCIFAANTSCIPIGKLGACTTRSDRVIGIHFMNPVSLKGTVEVIPSKRTSAEVVDRTKSLLARLEKRPIFVSDSPGFVSNRVLMLMINEAIHLVQESVASPADIDAVFRDCMGHRMGPLETADLIGLDTIRNSLLVLQGECGQAKFRPCELLDEKVADGHLGRKTGRGFFDYGVSRRAP
jgi:3-hydroxybutyryl-CoA dehydrogenase